MDLLELYKYIFGLGSTTTQMLNFTARRFIWWRIRVLLVSMTSLKERSTKGSIFNKQKSLCEEYSVQCCEINLLSSGSEHKSKLHKYLFVR